MERADAEHSKAQIARDSRGAYGFRLVASDPGIELPHLREQQTAAERLSVTWRHASSLIDVEEVSGERIVIGGRGNGLLRVDLVAGAIDYCLPNVVGAEAMVHPLLTLPVALIAHRRGDLALHGGAFLHEERAWVVCGGQMAGKSSLLAALAEQGVPIVADDLVVVRDTEVLAGPGCVDLRPDAAARFAGARSIGVVGDRERFRLLTPAAPARVPLGGILTVEWAAGDDLDLRPLGTPERLAVVHRHHYASALGPPPALQVLTSLGVPMWRLRRPGGWAGQGRALEALLTLPGAAAQGPAA